MKITFHSHVKYNTYQEECYTLTPFEKEAKVNWNRAVWIDDKNEKQGKYYLFKQFPTEYLKSKTKLITVTSYNKCKV